MSVTSSAVSWRSVGSVLPVNVDKKFGFTKTLFRVKNNYSFYLFECDFFFYIHELDHAAYMA